MSSTLSRSLYAATTACALVAAMIVPTLAAAPVPAWESPATIGPLTPAGATVARSGAMSVVLSDGEEVFVVQRPLGGDWGAPESVGAGRGGGWAQLAYDKAGHLVIAWADNTSSGTSLYSRRTLDDGTWGTTEQVATRATGESTSLHLAVSPQGAALLGWSWAAAGTRLLVSSRPADGTWSATTRLAPTGSINLALGTTGWAAVAVSTVKGPDVDRSEVLTLFRRAPDGTWGSGEPITEIGDITFSVGLPDVAVDKYGKTTLVWRDQANDGRWQVLVARTRAGRPLNPPRVLAPDTGSTYESGPHVVSNPDGGVMLVTWTRGNGALMGARWLQGGPDKPWGPRTQLASPTDDVLFWSTAMAPRGRAVVVWTKGGWFGTDGRGILARRMNAWGAWGSTAQVTPPRAHVLLPFAGESAQGSLAVWSQRRPGDRWVTRASAYLVQ